MDCLETGRRGGIAGCLSAQRKTPARRDELRRGHGSATQPFTLNDGCTMTHEGSGRKLCTLDDSKQRFRPFDWMRDVTHTTSLSVHAVAVALSLLARQRQGEITAVRVETLAQDAHTSRRSALTALKELRTAGLLNANHRNSPRGRLANGYRLTRNMAYERQNEAIPSAHSAHGVSAHSALGGSAHSAPQDKENRRDEIYADLDWPE